ncbi:cholesterol 24-hydroxylase-like isoform X1 [Podarcis raffonei]|uniref:cholesterol 24-hydroxylase-like isoform X1 n=1 Tax=Podarcis raffonei TaxID=65483 RepID=UPI0023298BA8|nr:cholesterol 24-hydroxylase-like isoform X1 [Podarcis raffonei]
MEALEVIWGLLRLLLAVSLLAFGLYCCYLKSIHMKYDYIPSAPRASFFLGHLPMLWGMLKNNECAHQLFLQWANEYGPILRFNAFHRVVVLVLSPEGVKEFLMLPQYPKDPVSYGRLFNLFGVRFLGNGLVTDSDYDHWHKQRKIMDPAFSRNYLMGLMGPFNEQTEELMRVLDEKADGETAVDVMSLLKRVTLDIIAKVAFGLELNTLHDETTPFPHAMSMIMKGLGQSRSPSFKYLPKYRKEVKEVQESLLLLRRFGSQCIEQRRKAIQNGEEIPLDILTQILKSAAEEGDCDAEILLDNFVTFFIAGHETTANLLSFTILELGRQPDILKKLQAEVDEVVGVKRDVAYENLAELKYLSQVLKESLRLYPPAPGTVRWTEKECVIEGIKIPAETTLMFSTYVMGRLEMFFKDALVFDPERFSKDQPRPSFCYFPFSLGPRSCIGQIFALMEAKVVMAKFLQRFEFQLVPPQSFKIQDTGTLMPSDGVVCRLKPRRQMGGDGNTY